MIVFRNADVDVPFFWESDAQPAGRWHEAGEGPAQYLETTPDAAWAEFLRHQEIHDPADLAGVERALWAVEIGDDEPASRPSLADHHLLGGPETYPACQDEARRLRHDGATRLVAPTAAVDSTTASGWRTDSGLVPGGEQDEETIVLFGHWPMVTAWHACQIGRPAASLLARVRPLSTV